MSALTKILIVLISLLSIFLCGVTATYVGTAENYKTVAADLKSKIDTLNSDEAALRSLFDSQNMAMKVSQEKLRDKYAQQLGINTELEIDLRNEERSSLDSKRRLDTFLAQFAGLELTIKNMEVSLKTTQDELEAARTSGIEDRTELAQLTDKLYEQIVQIQNLQVQAKRLVEEKTVLENNFERPLPNVKVVTPEIGKALPSDPLPVAATGGLKGLIMEVRGGLAAVSIGAADGLKKKDVLHVYRGGDFVCDIAITDVDTNKAAGVIEMAQGSGPRIGDTVTSEY